MKFDSHKDEDQSEVFWWNCIYISIYSIAYFEPCLVNVVGMELLWKSIQFSSFMD